MNVNHGKVKCAYYPGVEGAPGRADVPCFEYEAEPMDPAPPTPKSWIGPKVHVQWFGDTIITYDQVQLELNLCVVGDTIIQFTEFSSNWNYSSRHTSFILIKLEHSASLCIGCTSCVCTFTCRHRLFAFARNQLST